MAYSTPTTWAVAEVVTAAQLNTEIRDNVTYLHDTLPYIVSTGAQPSRVLGTIYQNSTKIRLITTSIYCPSTNNVAVYFYVASTSPPTTANPVAMAGYYDTNITLSYAYIPTTYLVPPAFYYKALVLTGNPVIQYWTEWDLF